jgi:UDP-GlcNAc3NAcA epimerase
MSKSIITIVGARPQFVKAAAVSRMIGSIGQFEEKIVHTGQHFDANMSDIFFSEMAIPKPHFQLAIHSLSHGAMTGRMLEQIEAMLVTEKPDAVMVYGDTNSTLAGALAASKLRIPLVHVEAGLRSFNMDMPEEINRILTDRISNLLFCPTQTAIDNLMSEGFSSLPSRMELTGDVMQDAAIFYAKIAHQKSSVLDKLKLKSDPYILVTFHRQENTDVPENLSAIVQALNAINKEIKVVAPLHPRTKKIMSERNLKAEFVTIDPVGYFDMIQLLENTQLVLTDSGGLQKEAFFFNKFCVTLRDQTEWVELVQGGYNQLTGANYNAILTATFEALNKKYAKAHDYYGGGQAASIITESLNQFLA